ncbi:hypothetical protein IFM89_024451 [Coptis chinensis]|uniref:DUF3444 domain-containing protein n=1 Tax=Coptis chinensis TaxID=261450 RepID=A0A835LJ72_9MAGN|nr:hypothetical protein IFM89_024451 [Coptis chinensis]
MEAALKEKRLAETLVKIKDYNGARTKLLKAQKLFPKLDYITDMIKVCNILCAANVHGCFKDWYCILEISVDADGSRIRSKYEMLVKSLERIRNVFPGTDSALTVVKNAFDVLCDKKKRLIFDSERERACNPLCIVEGFMRNAVAEREVGLERVERKKRDIVHELNRVSCGKKSDSNHYDFDNEKRWSEAGLPVVCGAFDLKRSNTVVCQPTVFSHLVSRVQRLNFEQVEICPKKGEVWALFKDWRPFDWCSNPQKREGCGHVMVEILVGYSKEADITVAPLAKVAGFRSVFKRSVDVDGGSTFTIPAIYLLRFSHSVPAFRFKDGEIAGVSNGMLELDPLAVPNDLVESMAKPSGKTNSSYSSSFSDHPGPVSSSIILDPENTSMEGKWCRKDFTSGQVWAVYDGSDSMPRRYVLVNSVISAVGASVTFLEPHPVLYDEIHWVEENLPFVCGLFKTGKTTVNLGMSQFSHLVEYEWSKTDSFYKIYPKKGDVWAMYKNWKHIWKSCDYNCHQCQVVEVLSDISEGTEMKITSLGEVDCCNTFFQRQYCDGFELIRTIPKREMLSFSHQIPCFNVPGIESYGIPEGSLHLEPDALPPRLAV